MVIYKVTNSINDKVYIGQTIVSLNRRISQHKHFSKNPKCHFHNAINKYGFDKFKFEIIANAESIEELNKLECYYISYYDSYKNGYNQTIGGEGVKNHKHTEESKQKMSKSRIGRFKGKDNSTSKPILQFTKDGQLIKEWDAIMDVERELNISRTAIGNNLTGQSKSSGGFVWRYKNE